MFYRNATAVKSIIAMGIQVSFFLASKVIAELALQLSVSQMHTLSPALSSRGMLKIFFHSQKRVLIYRVFLEGFDRHSTPLELIHLR